MTTKNSVEKTKTISVNKILSDINDNGGFDNFNNWKRKDIEVWVRNNWNCSKYVAEKVSYHLI